MSSSHFTSSIYLLTFSLLLQTIFGVDPLSNICLDEEFTNNDPYESNLQKLLDSIAHKTPPHGFGHESIGPNKSQTNGLALCHGDVNATECKTCVDEAITKIRKLCQHNKDAIIWYDHCLLKYSNLYFFGKVDIYNRFQMSNNVTTRDPIFNQKARELLTGLAKEATATYAYYATGELVYRGSKNLYGLAQCTLDLSSSDCFKCLKNEIDIAFRGKEGGRLLSGSCNIRFELYPFLNT